MVLLPSRLTAVVSTEPLSWTTSYHVLLTLFGMSAGVSMLAVVRCFVFEEMSPSTGPQDIILDDDLETGAAPDTGGEHLNTNRCSAPGWATGALVSGSGGLGYDMSDDSTEGGAGLCGAPITPEAPLQVSPSMLLLDKQVHMHILYLNIRHDLAFCVLRWV